MILNFFETGAATRVGGTKMGCTTRVFLFLFPPAMPVPLFEVAAVPSSREMSPRDDGVCMSETVIGPWLDTCGHEARVSSNVFLGEVCVTLFEVWENGGAHVSFEVWENGGAHVSFAVWENGGAHVSLEVVWENGGAHVFFEVWESG